ncbi:MAG: outer membrane lipoprotein chaperone LolA [Pseudomonadota bacterium]
MRAGVWSLLFAFCLIAPAVHAAESVADTALDRFLNGLTTWSGSFVETAVDSRGRKLGTGRGRLVIVRPGKFRWELAPRESDQAGQLLVADGRNLWFLDSELQQATVKPMGAALSQTPAMLLSGTGRIRDNFTIDAAGHSEGLDWVKVVPRQADADFKLARLGFSGADLARLVLEDKLGQKSTLVFEGTQRNQPIDPAQVSFTPPPGVDVIGTPQAAKAQAE